MKETFKFLKKTISAAFWACLLLFGGYGCVYARSGLLKYLLGCLLFSGVVVFILFFIRFKLSGKRLLKAAIISFAFISFFTQYLFFNNPRCPDKPPAGATPVFSPGDCGADSGGPAGDCGLASSHPYDVLISNKYGLMFVTHGKNDAVTVHGYPVVAGSRYALRKVPTGNGSRPQRMAAGVSGRYVFATNYGTHNDLLRFDLEKGSSDFIDIDTCKSSIDAAVDAKTNKLWALCEGSRTVIVYDIATDRVEDTLFLSKMRLTAGLPYSIAINQKTRKVYVTLWVGRRLVEIDADTRRMTRIRNVGLSAFKVAVDESRNLIYIAKPLRSEVIVLDGRTLKTVRRLRMGKGVRDIELIEGGRLVAGGGYIDGVFRIVDAKTGRTIRKSNLGTLIRGVYYDEERRTVWVAAGCGVYSIKLRRDETAAH